MAAHVGQLVQHREGRIREGNPMFPPGLHPGGGDGPQSAGPINFHPLRLENLTGAGGGQNQELQGQGRDAPGSGQLPQEGRHLGMGHGGVVGDALDP